MATVIKYPLTEFSMTPVAKIVTRRMASTFFLQSKKMSVLLDGVSAVKTNSCMLRRPPHLGSGLTPMGTSFCADFGRRTLIPSYMSGLLRSTRSLSSTVSTQMHTAQNNGTKWPLHSVKVTTSEGRWFEALHGLQFDVKYIDTCPEGNKLMPTVVCVHGAPGSHRDFSTIVNGLVEEGIRVIIPNLPGYDETLPVIPEDLEIFSHATDERTEFILSFIGAIGLSQIDALLGHSLGCSPLYVLGARCSSIVRSLVFVNPVPHDVYRLARPEWFFRWFPWFWDRKFMRPLLLGFLATQKRRIGFKRWKARHVAISCLTCSGLTFPMIQSSALEIRAKKIPFTFMWSKNDRMFEEQLCEETGRLLGVQATATVDGAGHFVAAGQNDTSKHYASAIMFEKGGHLCHRTHPQMVVQAVLDQLKHINDKRDNQFRSKFVLKSKS